MRSTPSAVPAERATLAWSRTALSALALAAVTLKAGLEHCDPAALVSAGSALVAAVVAGRHGRAAGRAPSRARLKAVAISASIAVVNAAVSVLAGVLPSGLPR